MFRVWSDNLMVVMAFGFGARKNETLRDTGTAPILTYILISEISCEHLVHLCLGPRNAQ
jgi:hypothetical protein